MIASDYIANYLADRGIRHCYGYQGTMIAFFVDAVCRNANLTNHVCYNEQGAAFAAVGEAKLTGKPAVAYATSGPGAANLLSGIADAYYDSAPVIFFTGQLNTYEYQDIPDIKQHGFQEMNIVAMASPVTKYAVQVTDVRDLPMILATAFHQAVSGRPGPVLIDLPMNIQREEMFPEDTDGKICSGSEYDYDDPETAVTAIMSKIRESSRPLLLLGNGAAHIDREELTKVIEWMNIPVVTSLLGKDILPDAHPLNFGYIGYAYGHRYANIIINKKTDLIISLGCNMNRRQTGMKTGLFARNAGIIRVDIDPVELKRKIHDDDVSFCLDCGELIKTFLKYKQDHSVPDGLSDDGGKWLGICKHIKEILTGYDRTESGRGPNRLIEIISEKTERAGAVICDVGQHQMWGAQSYHLHPGQRMLFSGGHGAMGFSVPAAIGAYYGCGKPVITLTGDGSMQMNIQELQWIFREQLPVTIFVMNNRALGLIHQQQDALFEGRYYSSVKSGGYLPPDFSRVAEGYSIHSVRAADRKTLEDALEHLDLSVPNLIEIILPEDSRAVPKTSFGEEMHNQSPLIPESLLEEILSL